MPRSLKRSANFTLQAANSLAHSYWLNMPVASVYEQSIVQQLLPKHK